MSALLSSGKRTSGSIKESEGLGNINVFISYRTDIAKSERLALTSNLGDIDDLIFNEDYDSHISDK